jgi:hypothetical protein
MARFLLALGMVGLVCTATRAHGAEKVPPEIPGVWYLIKSEVNQERLKASSLSDADKKRYGVEEPYVVKETKSVAQRPRYIFEKSGAFRQYIPCCGSTHVEEGRWKVVDYGANREVHTVEVTLRRNDPATKKPLVWRMTLKEVAPNRIEITPLDDDAVYTSTVDRVAAKQ